VNDLRILVVDDNIAFCASVERALNSQGYSNVKTAADPWRALELVKEERPGLVLLDLYLPGMDGLHLMTAIHRIDKSIPVLMLTCETDEECINAAASLGAADYLTKPLQLSTLFSSLKTCLQNPPRSS